MRYVEQKCPSDYLNDINCSNLVRETLYWVCKEEYDPYSFFMEDDLYPISTSEHYVRVVSYLQECINAHRKIVICGDYDCDGICSTTLLVMGLQECGITPGYYIPNRFTQGYGYTNEQVVEYDATTQRTFVPPSNWSAVIWGDDEGSIVGSELSVVATRSNGATSTFALYNTIIGDAG